MLPRDLDYLDILQIITLTHSTDNIRLICPVEQEMASSPDVLERHMCATEWEVNPLKF